MRTPLEDFKLSLVGFAILFKLAFQLTHNDLMFCAGIMCIITYFYLPDF